MAGSPVKLGIIAALVVVGVVVLAGAFNVGSIDLGGLPDGGQGLTGPTSPPPTTTTRSPGPSKPAEVQGVEIGVYNGTVQTGLAGDVARTLQREGYVPKQVCDANSPVRKTAIYWADPGSQAAATQMEQVQFPGASVAELPTDLQVKCNGQLVSPAKGISLVVLVGADQANG